jgi:hypothetical protein
MINNDLGTILGRWSKSNAKRRVFVSFHHQLDQWYYDYFTKYFDELYDAITDRSVEDPYESEDPDYIMRKIREDHIQGSSCTIVLCGENTSLRKYIDWEINATLQETHGLICVLLPSCQKNNWSNYVIPDRLQDNINSGYAVQETWSRIIGNTTQLQTSIELANSKSKSLIRNARETMKRNRS